MFYFASLSGLVNCGLERGWLEHINLCYRLKLNLPNTSHPMQEPILADPQSTSSFLVLTFLPTGTRKDPTVAPPFLWEPPFQELRVRRFPDAALLNSSDGEGGIWLCSSFLGWGTRLQRGFGFGWCWRCDRGGSPISWLQHWCTLWLIHTWGSAARPNSWARCVSCILKHSHS